MGKLLTWLSLILQHEVLGVAAWSLCVLVGIFSMDEPSSVTFLLCCVPSCDGLTEVCYDLLHDVIQKSFFCFSSAKLAEHVLGKYWSQAPDSENKRTTAFRIFLCAQNGVFRYFLS